jgi:ribosomal protein S16
MSYNSEVNSVPETYPPWQACWNEQYQCYYFWNTETNETTYDHPSSRQSYSTQTNQGYNLPLTNIDALFDKIDNIKEELDKEKPLIIEKLKLTANNSEKSSTIDSENVNTPETNNDNEEQEAVKAKNSELEEESAEQSEAQSNYPTSNQTHHEEQEFDSAYYDLYRQEGIAAPSSGSYYPSNNGAGEHSIVGAFNTKTGKFQTESSLNPENVSVHSKAARMCDAFFDYQSYQDQRNYELDEGRMQQYFNPGHVPARKVPKLTKSQIKKLAKAKKEKKEMNKKKWLLE